MNRYGKSFLAVMCGVVVIMSGCGSASAPASNDAATTEAVEESTTDNTAETEDEGATEEIIEEDTAEAESAESAEEAESTEPAEEAEGDEATEEESNINFSEFEAPTDETSADLPAYEYPDKDSVYYAIANYMITEVASNYDKADVSIPVMREVAIDDSDSEDIKVYGDFFLNNLKLKEDTLEIVSGGDYPGLFHLKKTDSGYEVTSFDVVEDGEGWNDSAKKIFGDNFDKFMNIYGSDDDSTDNTTRVIEEYVKTNNLSVTKYQQYGWDPITLGE